MAQVVQNKSSSLLALLLQRNAAAGAGGRRRGMDVAKLEGACKANQQAPSLARIFMNLPSGRRRRRRYLILFVLSVSSDNKRAAQFVFCKK